jgi:hypothetical protein
MRLGFAFEEFAREMYHDNMWTGRLTSTQQISSSVAQLDPGFGPVAYPKNRQAIVVPYAERRLQLPLLSAKLFHFWAQTLPAERQGHLVVSVEAAEASSTVSAVTAEARGRTLPPVGSPSTLTPLSLIQGKHVTKGLFASPGAAPDDVNRVSLILVNRSPVVQAPTITVRRWLLMPPAWVQFSRRDEGGYRISWPESELKQAGGGVAFGGYHVYRRRFGQAEFPDRPLNAQAILAESYTDAEAAKGFFEYTVRVRDSLDNLSEPAPLAMEGEPFEGVWSGWLSVTKGNLTTLAMRWLDAELAKASLGGGQVQAAKAHVRVLVGALDMLLRFGIPMTWQVERVKDQYMVRPLTVLGQPVEDSETLQLRRLGRYTIGLLPTTPRGRPIILSLSGKDQIRRRFEGTMRDPDLGVMEFGVRIVFDRAQ